MENFETNTPLSPHSGSSNKATIIYCIQIALGMADGRIFILNNFNLTLYANVKLTLTKILSCPQQDGGRNVDIILCCGYFNSLLVYHKGELLQKVSTSDWVNSITVTPCDVENEHNIFLGTLDGAVQLYKMCMFCS